MDSGTALFSPASNRMTLDTTQSNFTTLASAFNCTLAASQVDCLRNISSEDIEDYLNVAIAQKFKFLPIPDEKLVFNDSNQRYDFAGPLLVPAIIGTNQHELNALEENPAADLTANKTFFCTAVEASKLRQSYNRTTYRFRYDGNFSNISPAEYPGAYHGSELPLLFGTAGQYHGESTDYENEVSILMQDLWLEFAKDPRNGLTGKRWSPYGEGKAVLLGGADVPMAEIGISELDDICNYLTIL